MISPATREQFMEIRSHALEIWYGYDNTYGYVDEKISMIRGISYEPESWQYIVSMFDWINKQKLYDMLSPLSRPLLEPILLEEREALRELAEKGIVL